MKKLMILIIAVFLFSIAGVYAANITTCTLVNPSTNQYDNGVIKLNATAIWNTASLNTTDSVTNVTFIFYGNGTTTVFSNSTANGTRTNATAGATALTAQYTFTLTNADLADNAAYSAVASCYDNTTDTSAKRALNSSVAAYTIDTLAPSVAITNPLSGSTVVPNNNIVTFEYTPTDANLANCSLSLNNALEQASTTGTTSPNVSSGSINRFKNQFGADNTSVRVAITCVDLAGLDAGSNNFTFNVLLGAVPLAVRQAQAAAAAGGSPLPIKNQPSTAGQRFSAALSPSAGSSHFQQYGWMYVVGILLFGGLAIKLKWFK